MQYLNQEDLTPDSYQRFITESIGDADGSDVVDKNEARAIALVKTYINDLYDTKSIFGYTIPAQYEEDKPVIVPPIRNELLVDIISKITLYKIIRRNAARKVPEDYKDDFNWAIGQLERINSGRIALSDLPPSVDEDGNTQSESIWGNLSNPDFFI